MVAIFKKNWKIYLIESWALGMFMVSACLFSILLEYPFSPLHKAVPDMFTRQVIAGVAMGITAVLLIYSPWGKRSGAHMNPAVTLANFQMQRISAPDTVWYILAQFAGGALAVYLFKWSVPQLIAASTVKYAVTLPGPQGIFVAFVAEFGISFLLLLAILICSNSKYAGYTGWVAGFLVMIFIIFEGQYSGMSINPARTVASALPSGIWTSWWLYFLAPIGGMLSAGILYRRWYRIAHNGNCLTMKCHLSGNKHDCRVYEVLGPTPLLTAQTENTANHFEKNGAMLPV